MLTGEEGREGIECLVMGLVTRDERLVMGRKGYGEAG